MIIDLLWILSSSLINYLNLFFLHLFYLILSIFYLVLILMMSFQLLNSLFHCLNLLLFSMQDFLLNVRSPILLNCNLFHFLTFLLFFSFLKIFHFLESNPNHFPMNCFIGFLTIWNSLFSNLSNCLYIFMHKLFLDQEYSLTIIFWAFSPFLLLFFGILIINLLLIFSIFFGLNFWFCLNLNFHFFIQIKGFKINYIHFFIFKCYYN